MTENRVVALRQKGAIDDPLSMIAETGPQIFTEKGPRFETRTDGGARPGEAGRGCAAGASAGQ